MARIFNTDLIKNFTQTRFCAVLISKNNGKPIPKIPLFAEINANFASLPNIAPDYIFTELKHETFLSKYSDQQRDVIKDVLIYTISRYVDSSYYDKINKDKYKTLEEIIFQVLNYLKTYSKEISKNFTQIEDSIKLYLESILKDRKIENHDLLIQNKLSFPLGFLATDHVGYVSYDISDTLKLLKTNNIDGELSLEYLLYPYGLEKNRINVVPQGRYTEDIVFSKIELENLPHYEDMHTAYNYQSMQNPALIDWYLSPSSFSVNPSYFIGQDGCENIFPANFATQEFRFFQIVRGKEITEPVNITERGNVQASKNPKILTGLALEYLTTWQPLGHTLGQIIYSLPLAPGETVKIAILDWARKSVDSRYEDLTVKEQLEHNTRRDRNISETVEASLHEWQRGGSILGGKAASAGFSLAKGPLGIAGGEASSLGGAYSTSSGDRDMTAKTIQQISDAFAQHSSSFRELRSTVVIQSNQQESAKAETRVIANHNHSHSLTMLYYEVLRHYKVTTEFMRVRNSLMVDYSNQSVDFTDANQIIKYRKILESVLIDERYLGCFDAVQKYLCSVDEASLAISNSEQDADYNKTFDKFKLTITTGDDGTDADISFSFKTKKNGDTKCKHINNHTGSDEYVLDLGGGEDDFEQDNVNDYVVKPDVDLKWGDISRLKFNIAESFSYSPNWKIKHLKIIGYQRSAEEIVIFDGDINELMDNDSNPEITRPIIYPNLPPKILSAEERLSEDERCCVNKLKKYLVDNAQYYKSAIWLFEDPNERAIRFDEISFEGKTLLDYIDNRPIDVLGNYVVFPSNFIHKEALPFNAEKVKTEKLMTMPTRGVFGEAKLGHCNASEIIDNTRFWDWQTSPITEQAPEINPVSTDSRNVTQNLTPSSLPSSIVNIVNPANLPDPTGLGSALNLLGKSDLFKDMSMSKEVNDLLKKLSDNTISIAEAANKAREITANQEIEKVKADAAVQVAREVNKAKEQAEKPSVTPKEAMDTKNVIDKLQIPEAEKQKKNQQIANNLVPTPTKKIRVKMTFQFLHEHTNAPLDGEFSISVGSSENLDFDSTRGGSITIIESLPVGEHRVYIEGKRNALPSDIPTLIHFPAIGSRAAFDVSVDAITASKVVNLKGNNGKIIVTEKTTSLIHNVVATQSIIKKNITIDYSRTGGIEIEAGFQVKAALAGVDLGGVNASGKSIESSTSGEKQSYEFDCYKLTGGLDMSK